MTATRLRGLHVAVVAATGEAGDTGAPGEARRGQVSLRLPWLTGDETTRWARVAVPMAGDRRGSRALPAVGEQVIVAFENGDVDRPIVIGALWSNAERRHADGDAAVSSIRSRAGHRVLFDDRDGGGVTIVDANRRNAVVLDPAGRVVRVTSAGDLVIRASRDVVFTGHSVASGATTVTLRAADRVAVAGATATATAGSRIAANASAVTIGSAAGVDSSGARP
jgi:uncharacterized protein involved in type VI secretion and phage assembly